MANTSQCSKDNAFWGSKC